MPVGRMLMTTKRVPQCGKSGVFYAAEKPAKPLAPVGKSEPPLLCDRQNTPKGYVPRTRSRS
jgi:hypothetical protein